MRLSTLIVAHWRRRPLPVVLTLLLLAVGFGMLVFLLHAKRQVSEQMTRDARGVDLVVGAKGSPLQLVLSAVYHVDMPTGNVPLGTLDTLRAHKLVQAALPVSLGDNHRGFRIVGTEHGLIDLYGARLAQGSRWQQRMQVVAGARAAQAAALAPGSRFFGAHGLSADGFVHDDAEYTVVGVLAPTGTVLDRLLLTDVESVWYVHEGEARDAEERRILQAEREVTAVLVRYASPLAAAVLPRQINAEPKLQAAVPAAEVARLFAVLGVGLDTLRAIALVLVACALLSLFVGLMQVLEDRRYDLAIVRLLGASPLRVALLLLQEAWLLVLGGVVLGSSLAWAGLRGLGVWLAQARSVDLTPLAPDAGWLWLAVIALALATLAAAWPAWRAARLDLHGQLADGR